MSENARKVLNVLALFRKIEILGSLVIQVVDFIRTSSISSKVSFANWLKWELVNNVSLVQLKERNGSKTFNMHPLIRQFVVSDL